MPSIDERIVKMQFDNANFEKNVGTSLGTIDKLKKSLDFSDSTKSLNQLEDSVKHFSLDDIGRSIDSLAEKFNWSNIFKMGLLGEVTSRLVSTVEGALGRIKGALQLESLDPIGNMLAGWSKYADKTESVATIMAATGKSMEYVSEQLDKLNYFTDETSYNFTDMTSNIGKFTANGIELEAATSAMEGIATWAARSGQNAGTASRVMYNLAQAIGMGALKLQDWKSVELANMGTQEFKKTALDAAVALGKLKKETDGTFSYLDTTGKTTKKISVNIENFRETLSSGWLDNEVLMKTLNEYGKAAEIISDIHDATGMYASDMYELVDAQKEGKLSAEAVSEALKASGDEQWNNAKHIAEVQEQITKLASDEYAFSLETYKAAQEARTFGAAMDAVADAVSTSWMNVFELIFGGYEQAKELWTDLANNLIEVFQAFPNSLVSLFQEANIDGFTAFKDGLDDVGISLDQVKGSLISMLGQKGYKDLIGDAEDLEDAIRKGYVSADLMNKVLNSTIFTGNKVEGAMTSVTDKFDEYSDIAEKIRAGAYGSHDKSVLTKMFLEEGTYTEEEIQYILNLAEEQHKIHRKLTREEAEQIDALKGISKQVDITSEEYEKLTDEQREELRLLYEQIDRQSAQQSLFEGLQNVGHIFLETVKQISAGLTEMFPPITAAQLRDAAARFAETTGKVRTFLETSDKLKKVVVALALPFRVIADLVQGAFSLLRPLASLFFTLASPFIGLAEHIGESILAVKAATGELDPFASIIKKTAEAASTLIEFVTKIVEYVGGIVKDRLIEKFSGTVSSLGEAFNNFKTKRLQFLDNFIDAIKNADIEAIGDKIINFMLTVWHLTEPLRKGLKMVAKAFSYAGKFVKDFRDRFQKLGRDKSLSFLERVFLALQGTITKSLRVIKDKLKDFGIDIGDIDQKFLVFSQKVKTTFGPLLGSLTKAKKFAKELKDVFVDTFRWLGEDSDLNTFEKIWESIKKTAEYAFDRIKAKAKEVLSEMGFDVDDLSEKYHKVISSVTETLGKVQAKIEIIKGYFKELKNVFSTTMASFGEDSELSTLEKIFEAIKQTAIYAFERIKEKVKSVFAGFGIDLSNVEAALKSIKDFIASFFTGNEKEGESFFSKIVNGIKEAFDLKGIENFGDLVEKVFSGIGTIASKSFSGIKQGIKNLGLGNALKMFLGFKLGNRILGSLFKEKDVGGLKGLSETFSDLADTLKEGGIKGLILGKGGDSVIGTFKNLATSLLMVGGALFLTAAALALLSIIKPENLTKAFIAMVASLASVGAILIGLTHYMKEFDIKPLELIAVAASILILSVALIALAGALALFTLVARMDGVWKGLGAMAASLGVVALALGLLAYNVNGLNMVGVAAAILITAVALIVLAGALAAFTAVTNMDGTAAALVVLAITLGIVVVALMALGTAALGVLAGAAALLIASVAVLGFAIALGILVAVLYFAGPALESLGKGIVGLVSGICESIALVIQTIANGIVEIATGLSEALKIMSEGILEASNNVGIVVEDAFGILAEGITVLGAAIGESIASIGTGIGTALSEIGAGIAEAGTGIGAAFAEIGAGIGTAIEESLGGFGAGIAAVGTGISEALTAIGTGIKDAGTGIGTAFAEVGSGIGIAIEESLGGFGAGIAAIGTGISEALTAIGTGAKEAGTGIGAAFAEVGSGIGTAIDESLGGLGSGIEKVGKGISEAIESIGTSISTQNILISSSIETLGEGIGTGFKNAGAGISESITTVSGSISEFGTSLSATITEVSESLSGGIDKISESVTGIATSIGNAGGGLSTVGTGLTSIADGLRILSGLVLDNVANGLNNVRTELLGWNKQSTELTAAAPVITSIKDALYDFIGVDSQVANVGNLVRGLGDIFEFIGNNIDKKGNLKNVDALSSSVSSALSSALTAIQEYIPQFQTTGEELITSLAAGIEAMSSNANTAAGNVAFNAYKGARIYTDYFDTIGYNMSIGLANGIAEGSSEVIDTIAAMCRNGVTTARNILRVRSPSRVFAEIGDYVALGMANGIQNGVGSVTNAAADMAQNTIDAVQLAMSNINYALSNEAYTPTITPVIDLSNASGSISSLYTQMGGLNLNGGRYQVDGELIERGASTRNIVNEIARVNDRLALLGERMENMQIVLDSGVLVGATSAQMDAQFGIMNMRKGRGN